MAAEKPASSTEKNSKPTASSSASSSSLAAASSGSSSASRNGEIIDQIAEESRISEVEAQEKSYANSGQPQGPPPIPVPVPVQVRPGALVLPSPGRNSGGNQQNYENGGYEYGGPQGGPSSYAKMQDSASAQSATFQTQPLTMQKQKDLPNQRGPPPSPQSQQGGGVGSQQQQQSKQPQGPGGPFSHLGSNMPSQGPKQAFSNQGTQSKNHGQNLPPQLQGLPLAQMLPPPPQLANPSQHRPNGPPFNQNPPSGMLQHPPGAILLPPPPQGPNFPHPLSLPQPQSPSQRNNPAREAQQKANINQDLLPQQSNPAPQVGELGVGVVPMGGNFPGFPNGGDEQWPQSNPEMPQILHLEAKCEKNLMKVAIKFDKPFFGVIFSKGNYDNEHCVYMRPGQGRTSATFDIAINGCGTTGNTQNGLYGYGEQSGSGSFFENTIIVQYDPLVQEVWDQARKLRCSWHDYYEKSVTFKPFNVEMLDIVHTDFAGDNVGCWMQIQVGKGPWANEVTGIVKIGQTMTMVLAIKDEENKFDMLVRDCVAHDGKRTPIELVDDRGCIVRSKLMSKFTKIKNFGTSASVMSYAHFQAFKFPDSMDVHFQCTIQICRYQCPEQCSQPIEGGSERGETMVSETLQQPAPYVQGGRPRLERAIFRLKRSAVSNQGLGEAIPLAASAKSIGVDRNIKVVSTGDLAFNLDNNSNTTTMVYPMSNDSSGLICISTPSFTVTVVFLLAILVISCIVSTFLCLRHRSYSSAVSSCGSSSTDSIYKSKPNFYQFLRKATY